MARFDPHSYNDSEQAAATRLDWKARVDFDARTLHAEAVLHFERPAEGRLDLDTRDLRIDAVTDAQGQALPFTLHDPEPILGARLEVILPRPIDAVRIAYRTSPDASALQWLTPEQTFGGRHPFLFSQCQAIHARSVVPLQDTPRLRIRYTAEMTVPAALRGLMAAAFVSREVNGDTAVERYEMPQPIPPYLFALAVGDLDSRDLGPRSRVWAEPAVVDAAAWEFAQVDHMLVVAESLFGSYDWDRFDVLTMPQSFPYGGMENPRLTFITPTLLAKDRSLVNVVAHELAHSWTGNLVSNSNAEHFWLNEGFTVFAERRIQEALEGEEMCGLHAALGRRNLDQAFDELAKTPQFTQLRTHLAGVDPDEIYSSVPYEKGYLFLRRIEDHVGRERFDAFLRAYIETFRFRSITTEDFMALLEARLPGVAAAVRATEWLDQPGAPSDAPRPRSERLDALQALIDGGGMPSDAVAAAWSPVEWTLFLEGQTRPAATDRCATLDARFHLSDSGNYEILVAWLELAAASGYAPALDRVEEVLSKVGRMKYLKPLYNALARRPDLRSRALACFERYGARYHPIARQVIAGLLQQTEPIKA